MKKRDREIFETNKVRYGYRGILAVLRQKGYIIKANEQPWFESKTKEIKV